MAKPRPEGPRFKRCASEIAPDEGDARHRAGGVFHELAASVRAKEAFEPPRSLARSSRAENVLCVAYAPYCASKP
jgi:hypothetical protein